MSVRRCCCAARSGRLPLACSLGLVLAIFALLLVPTFALAFVYSGDDDAVCLAPEPPGDWLTVVATLDACHGWLLGGPVLLSTGCRWQAVPGNGPAPRGLASTTALLAKPPPPCA